MCYKHVLGKRCVPDHLGYPGGALQYALNDSKQCTMHLKITICPLLFFRLENTISLTSSMAVSRGTYKRHTLHRHLLRMPETCQCEYTYKFVIGSFPGEDSNGSIKGPHKSGRTPRPRSKNGCADFIAAKEFLMFVERSQIMYDVFEHARWRFSRSLLLWLVPIFAVIIGQARTIGYEPG